MKTTPEQLRALAKKALAASIAPQTEVWATASADAWVRFAANTVSTAGATERTSLSITAAFGTRTGTARTEDVTPDGIARAARQAADLAKILPASPEYMPPAGPQKYPAVAAAWDAATAASSAAERAAIAGAVLGVAQEAGLVGSGILQTSEDTTAFVSSAGASGVHRSTSAQLECTLRAPDGSASGWAGAYGPSLASVSEGPAAGRGGPRAGVLDARGLARRAAEKAERWKNPETLPPGRYTAILEPSAVEPLAGYLLGSLDRRSADEGRSPFSATGGGKTRIGEALFAEKLSISCDPADKAIPGSPFGEDGLAAKKLTVVKNGTLTALPVSRYWAKHKKLDVSAEPGNWVIALDTPDPKGLEGLIASTERGILVTRIWYVRMLAPQNLTVTGLTRDATFLVENGAVTRPIKNFRINQSLLELFKNVEAASAPVPLADGGRWIGIPAIKVRDLNFSSPSDAV